MYHYQLSPAPSGNKEKRLPGVNREPQPASDPHRGNIGQIVRRLRDAAHLSRAELAKQAHIADSTIRNIESARHRPTRHTLYKLRQHPSMARLRQLARAAGVYPVSRPTKATE